MYVSSFFTTTWEPSTRFLGDALGSLRLALDQYMAYDRWQKIYELNGRELSVLKNASEMKDDEWAKLCPIHLLVSCLPAKKFDPSRRINLQAEKWVESNFLKEVNNSLFMLFMFACRILIKFITLLHAEYGKAFFDLFHIKNCIERNNEETPLLWAVENVNTQ